jgi:hypothetical protein
VVRQIVTHTENGTIPRRDELKSTRTLNQESFAGRIDASILQQPVY